MILCVGRQFALFMDTVAAKANSSKKMLKKTPTNLENKKEQQTTSDKTTLNPTPKATPNTQLYLAKELKQKNL